MRVLQTKISLESRVLVEMTETEVKALEAIFGYNVDVFLKVFYEKMGKAYVQPHEAGVRALHETVRGLMANPIAIIDAARKRLNTKIPQ